jgi:poly(hydroxyalkanoate) granule-associated protein
MSDDKGDRNIQKELRESAHKIWLAGLGALAAAEEEGTKLFKTLVERGEALESKSREGVERVKETVEKAAHTAKDRVEGAWDKLEESFDERVAGALGRLGVPAREEIQALSDRVKELSENVAKLRKPASKKS